MLLLLDLTILNVFSNLNDSIISQEMSHVPCGEMSVQLSAEVESSTVWVRGINPALLFISAAEKEKWKFDHRQYRKVSRKRLWAKHKPQGYSGFEKYYICQTDTVATSKSNWADVRREVAGTAALPAHLPAQAPCLQPAACSRRRCRHRAPRAPLTPTCPPPLARLPLRTLHKLQHGSNLQQICLFWWPHWPVCRDKVEFS